MRELAKGIPEVAALLLDERWREATGDFEAAEDDGSWRKLLKLDTNGAPIRNMQNPVSYTHLIRITQQHLCMLISELAAGVILFLALWRSAKR